LDIVQAKEFAESEYEKYIPISHLPENSREQTKTCFQYAERKQTRSEVKASSFARAIRIPDEVLVHQDVKMRKMQVKRGFGSRFFEYFCPNVEEN